MACENSTLVFLPGRLMCLWLIDGLSFISIPFDLDLILLLGNVAIIDWIGYLAKRHGFTHERILCSH